MNSDDNLEKYVEQIFTVECTGRDIDRKEVLNDSVIVDVIIYKKPNSNMISSMVNCLYNAGGHACIASHPDNYKGDVLCPYSFDLPYALDKKK